MTSNNDLIDLRDVGSRLWRSRRWIAGCTLVGVMLAAVITAVLEERFEASTTVLVRDVAGMNASPLSRLTDLGGLSSVLGGGGGSVLDTEIQIMRSRSILGAVIDSLGLQLRVLSPRDVPPESVLRLEDATHDLAEGRYVIERGETGYLLRGPGVRREVSPGEELALPGLRLRIGEAAALEEGVEFEVLDRRDVLESVEERLTVTKPGGDLAEVEYAAHNPWVAAAVANGIVAQYFSRRQTTDRGVNQRRYEFLLARADSLDRELARSEGELRELQERSGVGDPEWFGQTQLRRAMEIQGDLEALEMEARTLRDVLAQSRDGRFPVRALAAFPTFLRNSAINNLLSQLLELEAERTQLLQRRTPRDPEVIALSETIGELEAQLVSLSASYLDGIERQREEIRNDLQQYRGVLASLPAQAEASYRKQREVELLAQMMAALQGELLQARLGAIAEGGDVRVVDPAVPPEDPSFPRPLLNLVIGLVGGLLAGVIAALSSGYLGSRIRDVHDVEAAVGLDAIEFQSDAPLLLAGMGDRTSIMVVPVGADADARAVGRRIAETAALRAEGVAVIDWSAKPAALAAGPHSADDRGGGATALTTMSDASYRVHQSPPAGTTAAAARAELEGIEQGAGIVISILPALDQPVSIALLTRSRPVVLVTRTGAARRSELCAAVSALRSLEVPLAAVVVHNGGADAAGSPSP